MSKKKRFEDLEIWSLSQNLYVELFLIFKDKSFRDYSFQDQILRATLSISNNIAEGFERQSDKELIRFLYISKGSSGEVRNMLYLAEKIGYLKRDQSDILIRKCTVISVKLHNLIAYLGKS